MWFHCRNIECDSWAREPEGFHELRHVAVCGKCGARMYPIRRGEPKDIGLGPQHEVKAVKLVLDRG